jgi:hypothetical protein
VVSFMPSRFTLRIGGWVGPRVGLDEVEKRKIPSLCLESKFPRVLPRCVHKEQSSPGFELRFFQTVCYAEDDVSVVATGTRHSCSPPPPSKHCRA